MAGQQAELKAQVDLSPILSFLTRYTESKHATLDAIYAHSVFAAAVVFRYPPLHARCLCRALPSLAQYIVQRLLFVEGAIPFGEFRSWHIPSAKQDFNKALWLLKHMSILKGRGAQAWLDSTFQRQLHQTLNDDKNGFNRIGVLDEPGKAKVDAHAKKVWERMLYMLVSPEVVTAEDALIIDLLTAAGLMEQCKEGRMSGERSITSEGFQFLLRDTYRQAWTLLEQYTLKHPEHLGRVLWLSLHPPGIFRAAGDADEAEFLLDMHSLGLVLKLDDECYSVTPMSTSLTTDPSPHSHATRNAASSLINVDRTGFIVVETNYRLYAYTSSPLQSAVLALFVHLRGHFPNLLYGVIARDSCRAAFSRGITADQIINYLTVNAHPQMYSAKSAASTSVLPHTLIDQLRIWYAERSRLVAASGFLYTDFATAGDFEDAVGFGGDAIVYSNAERRMLVVGEEANERLKEYIKTFRTRTK